MSKRKLAEQEADEIERQGADADVWKQEPVEIRARPSRTSVLSLRLPTSEFHALLRTARSVNESISDYVRKAILQRMRNEQPAATFNITYTQITQSGQAAVDVVEWRTATAAPEGVQATAVSLQTA